MRAIVQHAYGSTETLQLGDVARPAVKDGQVLVEVHAAGVDRGVWHLMTGMPYLIRVLGFGLTRPKNPTPGADVAGKVVSVGTGVERFKVGDEVFGIASGSYAEYAVADADKLALKPACDLLRAGGGGIHLWQHGTSGTDRDRQARSGPGRARDRCFGRRR